MDKSDQLQLPDLKYIHFDDGMLHKFITFLKKEADVFAPHKKGQNSFSYQKVENPEDIVLDYPRTIQPLKKYFLPPRETLLAYNLKSNEVSLPEYKPEKRIFFGVHSYEYHAVKRLDYSFSSDNSEWNYMARREDSLFIGVSFNPDEWHFSNSVGIEIDDVEGFSLFLKPNTKGYYVFIVDEKGKDLINNFDSSLQKKIIDKPYQEADNSHFKLKLKTHRNRIPKVFNTVYHSNVWDKVADKCVGCGTCNLLCPTCYCFDVRDEIELDIENGTRDRFWDSCMLNSFAGVAGGENFREKLSARTRHRLHRKFKYLTEKTGELYCVGCGRCSKYCPAEISIVEIINNLIDDYAHQQQKQSL